VFNKEVISLKSKRQTTVFVSFTLLVTVLSVGNIDAEVPSIGVDILVRRLSKEVRDKGWIAFCARSDKGDWDLFTCRPDGSVLRNITQTPKYNEAVPQFSHDGRRLLFRRLPRDEKIDGNRYGTQGVLLIARSDGTDAEVLGQNGEYPWASWSPDGKQIACLSLRGISFVDIASQQIVRRLDRKGFFQQLTWSPDGKWLCGVANSFGTGWSVARMDAQTGQVNAVSRVDCCTPDWFPDGLHLIFSNRHSGQKANKGYGWTQLWIADAEGKERKLVYAEEGRHVYGGHVSPDGRYVIFTGNMQEDGDPGNVGAPMALMRLADMPIVGGQDGEARFMYPNARRGPVLKLPVGWEPCWTFFDIGIDTRAAHQVKGSNRIGTDTPTQDTNPEAVALAEELHNKGWIVFSATTGKGNWDLFLMRPDGSNRRRITDTDNYNEAGARFSPDGTKLFYYRLPVVEDIDNNTYGTYELVIANSNGANPMIYGNRFKWASWGPEGKQIASLGTKVIQIVDLEDRKVVEELPRKGMVQQLVWSPDGKWFAGTANGLGVAWTIGRLHVSTGQISAVSETDRYNCTPDWLGNCEQIIYSRGIMPGSPGWAQLWVADSNGDQRRMLYAEEGRHIYGGCISPDGKYVLFTRSKEDLGKVNNSQTTMAIVRWKDTPMIGRGSETLRAEYPDAYSGPFLDLSCGWEPHWTYNQIAPAENKLPDSFGHK